MSTPTLQPVCLETHTHTHIRPWLPWLHQYDNSARQEVELGAYERLSHPSNPKFPGPEKAPSRLPLQPQNQHLTLVSLGLRSQALPHVCTQTDKHTISYGYGFAPAQNSGSVRIKVCIYIYMPWTCDCSLYSRPSSRRYLL